MARTMNNGAGGKPGSRQDESANVPPPSTLAAQIVQQQTRVHEQGKKEGQAVFLQLLEEIKASPSALEDDVDSNYKLISVVLEAGLNAVAADDLVFSSNSTAVSHAVACLEVIEISFRRNPAVLFHTSAEAGDAESPLYLLIVSKLLQLWKYSSIGQLRILLENLLLAFASTSYTTRGGKANAQKLERLYKACTEDLHAALSAITSGSMTGHCFSLQIPSSHARQALVADHSQARAVKRPWQAILTDPVQAASIELSMLSVLSRIHSISDSAPIRLDHNWIVGKLSQCRATLGHLAKGSSHNRTTKLDVQLVSVICDLLRVMNAQMVCSTLVEKTCLMLVRHISTMLEVDTMQTANELITESPLILTLLETAVAQHERVAEKARMLLLPYLQVLGVEWASLVNLLCPITSDSSANADVYMTSSATIDGLNQRIVERPLKRRRILAFPEHIHHDDQHALKSLCIEFGIHEVDVNNLSSTVLDSLKQQTDEQRLQKQLNVLARLPCASAKAALDSETIRCGVCQRSTSRSDWQKPLWRAFHSIISGILEIRDLHWSKDARILLMTAVQSFAYHTDLPEDLNMSSSILGLSCIQALVNPSREIRLAAVNALPPFLLLRSGHDEAICRDNGILVLKLLQEVLDGDDTRKWETAIKALGMVANSCEDTAVNLVLLRLIECLGSANNLACNLAQLELRNLAQTKSVSIDALFRPFWRTIAVSVAKDLNSCPQKAQQLTDLIGTSVDDFLLGAQEVILPYLIMWRRTDTLQRMATARKSSIPDMCMDKRNLTAILASLLVQDPDHPEAAIHGFLVQASPEFRKIPVSTLLRLDVVSVACELLKVASEAEEPTRKKISHTLLRYATIAEPDGKSARETASQARLRPSFFGKHALGMMTNFTQVIDNPAHPNAERLRHIKAIKLMIELARDEINVALPQICACLQSALQHIALKEEAFLTWLSLLEALDIEEHLASILEQTFTVLCNTWEEVSASAQQTAYAVIVTLLKNHQQLFQNAIMLIPSLQSIPLMAKLDSQLAKLREKADTADRTRAFSLRCRNENAAVRLQALKELCPFLRDNQEWLHDSVMSERPQPAIAELVRSLLDLSTNSAEQEVEALDLCAQCLGAIGCLDPVRVETVRESRDIVVLSNFETSEEAIEFVILMLETVLVKAFHSAPNPRAQGFLAYVMQEMLKFCGFKAEVVAKGRPLGGEIDDVHRYWWSMTDSALNTLTPLLSSRYVMTVKPDTNVQQVYPIYNQDVTHGYWLRTFVYDLLRKASGDNAKMIFRVLSKIIRGYDISISSFLLPFVAANVIIGGTVREVTEVGEELLQVLKQPGIDAETSRLCSENVFQVLDYLSKWSQGKRRRVLAKEAAAASGTHVYSELDRQIDDAQIASVETVLNDCVPADILATRAVECGSFARALFHWEQYIRQQREPQRLRSMTPQAIMQEREMQYHRLHTIYAEIDEPDGIEGISHFIQVFEPEEQVLEHEKNGRWSAAQSWYESYVHEDPASLDNHLDLMTCLQRAGQHVMVLDHGRNCLENWPDNEHLLSLMSESSWSSKRLNDLQDLLLEYRPPDSVAVPLNIGIGKVLLEEMSTNVESRATGILRDLRLSVMKTLSPAATASLQSCHDQMLKLHTLYEIDLLSRMPEEDPAGKSSMHALLSRRLDIVGSYLPDKQHLLSIRRAVMDVKPRLYDDDDKSQLWLQTARLARKGNRSEIAYNAILNALQLGDESAKIEQARLLWKTGEHRKAIQSLEGAIESNAFSARNIQDSASMQQLNATAATGMNAQEQNLLVAKANLLLAKWLDRAGQTSTNDINIKYQHAVKSFARWEKGLYHLGKFYNKLLETMRALPPQKQDGTYVYGDCAKLVVENYLRSLVFGCKYLHETMPKLLTLWLDFGIELQKPVSREVPDDLRARAATRRPEVLDAMNKQIKKYSDKIAPYLFYPALAQMITRVCHPNAKVYDVLSHIIVKVVIAYPRQALWPLLATAKSSAHDRASRGVGLLNKLRERANKTVRHDNQSMDFRDIISKGQKLSEQLLAACDAPLGDRTTGIISLTRDLRFKASVGQCPLVVPVDKMLAVNLPTVATDYYAMKAHKGFPTEGAVTIHSFTDDVLVLNSLQKPRKLTVRGSDGRKYGLLCKPKDDLRKDQRLMEYNAMVNRALKRDAECSSRRLYIRTYAVTPLNEECGIIEWVDGLKALRDIIIQLYRSKGIAVNYSLLKELLNEACAKPENHNIFTNQILGMYPAVLHEWFTDTFSDPESWFGARIRYTRSAAVASIVGHSLGLGDRHGENVMLEEGSGGVFHVDFNCLFEKGLTFEKPELVPFRLTHNMVDAFGAYGVEGPFRRSAECTARVMRSSEDALLTILETFVYDPTADFMGQGRRRAIRGVPETPKEILESVGGKLRGLLRGENVPLSVEGHVDALIRQATDPGNLSSMYIGWLSFF